MAIQMHPGFSFIYEMVRKVPELQELFDDHLRQNKGLLPHVFMGDVTRFTVEQMKSRDNVVVQVLLDYFEEALQAGSSSEQELIAASFVENLQDEKETLRKLKPMMGPYLKRAWIETSE